MMNYSRTVRRSRVRRTNGWLIWLAGLLVLAAATVLLIDYFGVVTYRDEQIGYALTMPKRFAREVELREEGGILHFVYKPVQALQPDCPYGVVGRLEIYDKATHTAESLQDNTNMYGLRLIGENSQYYFGVAHATDVQVPPDSSEQLLARFRALEAEFDSVIKSFQIVDGK